MMRMLNSELVFLKFGDDAQVDGTVCLKYLLQASIFARKYVNRGVQYQTWEV